MNTAGRVLGGCVAALLVLLTSCTGGGSEVPSVQPSPPTSTMVNINQQPRGAVADGGELRLPVDGFAGQFNPLHADGDDPRTELIMSALLPRLFDYDAAGNPVPNSDYLSAVDATGEDPQQVTYTLNPDAVWGSGRPLSAEDFIATWEACNGQNVSFQCADTESMAEVASVEQGSSEQQVVVTYTGSESNWPETFGYLLPKEGVADPETFNSGWNDLTEIGDWLSGPYIVDQVDESSGVLITAVNDEWWADAPKLARLTFVDVAADDQLAAVQDTRIDVAELPDQQARAEAESVAGCEIRTAQQGDREQAVLARRNLANYGAFGDSSVNWTDVGFLPPTT